jgi:tRNA 2-thiouridine synthesizing protein A
VAFIIDETLDARGLKCPLPVLLAKRALRRVAPGSVLEVFATDRGVDADFVDLCELTGAVLIDSSFVDGVYRFVLRASV